MTITSTRSGTLHDWELWTREVQEEPFHHAQEEEEGNKKVRIAVTDRGCPWLLERLKRLLSGNGVIIEIEPVNAENLDEIKDCIQADKIDGIVLTSWDEQHWQIAQLLDLSLLAQNETTTRPVPLLAYGEGTAELRGGLNDPYRTSRTHRRQVNFKPGSHLRRWTGVDMIWVRPERLHDVIPPSRDYGISTTATAVHDGQDTIEGIEVTRGGALHVGVRFDLVKLYGHGVVEGTAADIRAANAARKIIKGFVAEVRGNTAH